MEGNTFYPEAELTVEAAKMLDVSEELIKEGLKFLEMDQHVIREEMDSAFYIWVAPLYASEKGIIKEIKRLTHCPCLIRNIGSRQSCPLG